MPDREVRPPLTEVSDERTLRRWYWLKAELVQIARDQHLSLSGGKVELTERLAAHFSGRNPASGGRTQSRDLLPSVLTPDTVVQPGQRCTQALREWMRDRVGRSFTFDAATRAHVAAGGVTLAQLEQRWRERRPATPEPAEQFELNRFSQTWHRTHPHHGHAEMLDAWKEHRSQPRD